MENAEERAYRLIINEILSGVYHPGDFLLELDIAAQMEMSRTPVSRALSRLVAEGFLKKMPKKGCYIPIPTPKDAELVFTARQVAEGEAAALAAANVTEEDILTLESIVAQDKYIMDAGTTKLHPITKFAISPTNAVEVDLIKILITTFKKATMTPADGPK